MPEYHVTLDIPREQALEVLKNLSTAGHQWRDDLERKPDETLKGWGITVHKGMPDPVKLPPPETVAKVHAAAQALEQTKQPFGYFVLAVTFGAMPLVPGAD